MTALNPHSHSMRQVLSLPWFADEKVQVKKSVHFQKVKQLMNAKMREFLLPTLTDLEGSYRP